MVTTTIAALDYQGETMETIMVIACSQSFQHISSHSIGGYKTTYLWRWAGTVCDVYHGYSHLDYDRRYLGW